MLAVLVYTSTLFMLVSSCRRSPPREPPVRMVATFNASYSGQIFVNADGNLLTVRGQISGLPNSSTLGVHVHQYGDLGNGCLNAGGHYNPRGVTHGGPDTASRHPGDFGNVRTDGMGVANFDLTIRNSGLTKNNELLGLAVVVHAGQDDLGQGGNAGSLATGNSGARLTCAVLGIARP
ncbi:Cytosolic Cu-Zn superoxide dismutase [Fasciola hepatica]|uniref:Cytosolic Cu-Zn superoxide dismutase n=1 Tax=Fasciola hepatica TaxID=6192 RepID=A0A4E0RWK7_FASHE|nr:Cytosolic Cu-Zn superoxide dismutase [Fasciola hepatica]